MEGFAHAVAQIVENVAVPMTLTTITSTTIPLVTSSSLPETKKPCHGGMNHGGMSHANMAHGDMEHDMPGMKMCKMSMVLNADYENLCILTDAIMVTNKVQLILAILGITLFTVGYEYFKNFVDKLQSKYSQYFNSNAVTETEKMKYKIRLSISYALTVGYSFIIMLLFMTYNVWVMLSVCVGAGLGHYFFGGSATAPLVCH